MKRIDRLIITQRVGKKMKGKITQRNVAAVIVLFFEEIKKQLLLNKTVEITNFGTFSLKQHPDRKHMNFATRQMQITPGKKAFKFLLSKFLTKLIENNIKVDP